MFNIATVTSLQTDTRCVSFQCQSTKEQCQVGYSKSRPASGRNVDFGQIRAKMNMHDPRVIPDVLYKFRDVSSNRFPAILIADGQTKKNKLIRQKNR